MFESLKNAANSVASSGVSYFVRKAVESEMGDIARIETVHVDLASSRVTIAATLHDGPAIQLNGTYYYDENKKLRLKELSSDLPWITRVLAKFKVTDIPLR